MTEGISRHETASPAPRPTTAATLAIVSAVCGTLITQALDSGRSLALVGAALGAVIPVLINFAGPRQNLRVGVVIAATACALFVTYGGFTLLNFARGTPSTFPIPPKLPTPGPSSGTTSSTTTTTTPTPHGPNIDVTPTTLDCTADGCDNKVTITSTGDQMLVIGKIEFDGAAAAEFNHDAGCLGDLGRLDHGESCSLAVTFTPSGEVGTREARLIIHQNLPGDPSYVYLTGANDQPPASVDLEPVLSKCVFQPGGYLGPSTELLDAIQIFYTLRVNGQLPTDAPASVVVNATSDQGPQALPTNTFFGNGLAYVALPLKSADYAKTHLVTIRVDAKQQIAESDEHNNELVVSVVLPEKPNPSRTLDLSCST